MLPRRLTAAALLALATAAAADQPAGKPFPAERTCSAIDPSFVSIAEETGGLVLPLSPGTLAANTEKVTKLLTARLAAVDLARGQLDDEHRRIEAPVDAGVRLLVVTLCIDEERELALLDPAGVAQPESEARGFVLREGRHRIFYVTEPAPGPWALRLSGAGRYVAWVKVEGGTSIFEAAPDAAAEIPLAGEAYEWRFGISGDAKEAKLAFVDGDGARMAEAKLAHRGEEWAATLPTPAKAFRLQVSGADRFGTRFRRTLPRILRPAASRQR